MSPQPTPDCTDAAILLTLASGAEEEAMKEGEGLTWPQIRYWVTCGALIVVGAGLAIAWTHAQGRSGPQIARELGSGLLIAGILGGFVEPFFRNEFARDAFLAAFRRVLPDEFKEEVEKIIRFEFIATKKIWTIDIKRVPDTDLVLVTTMFERTIINKSKSEKAVNTWYELEDYRFPQGRSQVIECAIQEESQKEATRF